MKSRKDHWDKIVKVLKECMPDITAHEMYIAQVAFVVCFTMMANEFAIDDPEDFAKFLERIKEIVEQDKAPVAQSVEYPDETSVEVAGSNPVGGAID